MRILQLCKKFPYPLKDGESIAVYNLSKSLNDLGCKVTLLSMNTSKHYCDLRTLPPSFNHYQKIHDVQVDNTVQLGGAVANLFSNQSYHITRFISKKFENKLIEILSGQTFDIIQLETPILSHYIPVIRKYSQAKIVMRSHNVEHEIWGRIAENARFLPKKWYLKNAANKLQRYEIEYLNKYDAVLAITQRDRQTLINLGLKRPCAVVPIGLNTNEYQNKKIILNKKLSLSFIGSLDWMPNIEGLKWFLEHAWPTIHAKHPDLEFHIAGRNTPAWLSNMVESNVIVHGEISDAKKFITDHPIMIVPLFSGSGMRVKILEGMAMGRAVITTSIGLEGIEAKNGAEVLIANTADAFAQAISWLEKDAQKLSEIHDKSVRFIEQEHDNLNIAKGVASTYDELCFIKIPRQVELKKI